MCIRDRDWGVARLLNAPEKASEESLGKAIEKIGSVDITSSSEVAKTRAGEILGTLNYMPPEQLYGKDVGPKSDQFALGMVLFEMLTFTPARELSSEDNFNDNVHSGDRLSFSDVKNSPPVPVALQAIVNRATSKDPADRYPLSLIHISEPTRPY